MRDGAVVSSLGSLPKGRMFESFSRNQFGRLTEIGKPAGLKIRRLSVRVRHRLPYIERFYIMKKFLLILATVASLMFCASVTALADVAPAQDSTTVTIDLTKLNSDVASAILRQKAKEKEVVVQEVPVPTVSSVKEWASLGTELGSTIADTAKALSVSVNEFIKTPVGYMVVFLIFYKMVGASVWGVISGVIFGIVTGTIWWKSYQYYMIPRIVTNKKYDSTGLILVEENQEFKQYPYKSNDARIGAVVIHLVCAAIIVIITCLQVM